MKYNLLTFICFLYLSSCAQVKKEGEDLNYYDKSNFKLTDSLYIDTVGYYNKIFTNNFHPEITMTELYADSARTRLGAVYYKKDKIMDGPFKVCIAGYVSSLGFYKNGKKEGKWLDYFQNGQIQNEYYYSDGKKVGIWKSYDKKGKLLSSEKVGDN